MPRIDMTGKQFGRLVGVEYSHTHRKNAYWIFLCDCGNKTTQAAFSVRRGDTKSCGCWRKEVSTQLNRSHGQAGGPGGVGASRLYRIWSQMKRRCDLPTVKAYPRYGGRGIQVCAEWSNSFGAFEQWATRNGYDDSLTIDRRDNDGNYEPGNCRWATVKIQANNRRSNRMLVYWGEEYTLAELADICGISQGALAARLDAGWSVEDAGDTPVRSIPKKE